MDESADAIKRRENRLDPAGGALQADGEGLERPKRSRLDQYDLMAFAMTHRPGARFLFGHLMVLIGLVRLATNIDQIVSDEITPTTFPLLFAGLPSAVGGVALLVRESKAFYVVAAFGCVCDLFLALWSVVVLYFEFGRFSSPQGTVLFLSVAFVWLVYMIVFHPWPNDSGARGKPMELAQREPDGNAQPAGEEHLERLARFAGYSLVCGVIATFGIASMFIFGIAYVWGLAWVHAVPVPEVHWSIGKLVGFVVSLCVVVASYGALICGYVGCGERNTYNRTLAFIGVFLGVIGLFAGTLLTLAFSFD